MKLNPYISLTIGSFKQSLKAIFKYVDLGLAGKHPQNGLNGIRYIFLNVSYNKIKNIIN